MAEIDFQWGESVYKDAFALKRAMRPECGPSRSYVVNKSPGGVANVPENSTMKGGIENAQKANTYR